MRDYKDNRPPEYFIWSAIQQRCRNPKDKRFRWYGARGIAVCRRWYEGENGKSAFACFLADVGPRPTPKHSIDRIDNDGHYEPGNCRWALLDVQIANKRQNWTNDMPEVPVIVPSDPSELRKLVAGFIEASKAPNTRRSYAASWRHFQAWGDRQNLCTLPASPETVAAYLADLARSGWKFWTIDGRCAAIGFVHRGAGYQNPRSHPGVTATLSGIARTLGTASVKKSALTAELMTRLLRAIPDTLDGKRDRALILIGFAGAMRRSELVALDVTDIARHAKGLVLTIRRSKTDQAGAGIVKAIPHGRKLKVVAALDDWLTSAHITDGPIFRGVDRGKISEHALSAGQVARIVQKRCAVIGLDAKLFAGHSLRSGYISTAADHDASLSSIARHAGHAKLDTTLGYVQVRDAFKDHSGSRFL